MPASARPATDIKSNGDGSVTIKYVPTQSGVHELNVAYNQQPVTGQSAEICYAHTDTAAQRPFVCDYTRGGSVAEWLEGWTQAQKGPGSNRSRDAVG